MFITGLYLLTAGLLVISMRKDKRKTMMSLKKSWKSLENILPQFMTIILLIGMMLAVLSPQDISKLIGQESGWGGLMIAAVIGAVTLIPGFVAFPLAAALLKSGAGLIQVTVFVTSLMGVGVVTMPIEIKYFGRKAAILRNALALVFSFVTAFTMGAVLK
ncbi:MAG: permease [Deltaproteobacteria bacterium]|nr:permease [Deltaproteobacteria bacterium]